MKKITLFITLMLFLALSNSTVLINSYDGRDVITGTYYAAVIGESAFFIPNEATIEMITSKLKPVDEEELVIINGKNMVMPNLNPLLESKGYSIKEVINSDNPYTTNVNVAKKIKDKIKGFVLVSPEIGYNSIAPIPYAKAKQYYLLFADESVKKEIEDLTNGEKVLIYGFIPDDIKNIVKGSIVEINNGDKYIDNIELVDMLLEETGHKQVVLTDGNFLEYTLMNTPYPILYISTIVPNSVKNFLKESVASDRIRVALVVGKEYINTAYNLKRTINKEVGEEKLSIFAKLGETYPKISPEIFPTPIFVLPAPHASLLVDEINFNRNNNKITIVLKNTGNAVGYFTYSIKVYGENKTISTFGSDEIAELKPGEKHSIEKELSIGNDFEGSLMAQVTLVYGTSKSVLDNGYNNIFNVTTITFNDESSLKIVRAKYYPDNSLLTLELKNTGPVPLYYKVTVVYEEQGNNVEIEDNIKTLEPGKTKVLRYEGMEIKGENIRVIINYGAKDYSLKKSVEGVVTVEKGDYTLIVAIVIIVVVLIAVFKYLSRSKGSEKSDE